MSLNLGTISAAVTLDDSDYRKRLSGIESQSESTFKKVASLAAGYLSFRAIYSSGSMAIKTFSDLEESANRFNAVYGEIQNTATTTMQALRKEFGLSRKSAMDMLAGTGDLLTGFGFDQSSALQLSEAAAKLGADLYSFTNYKGGAKGATEALTKAMLGETEQAKALGVVIRQDSEEFKNLVAHFQKTKGATEQQAKALTVLEMATRQSKNAIGDWNRPGETFAQVAQAGKEQAIELASILGGQFQGPVKESMKTIGDLVKKYNEAEPATQRLITNSAILGAGLLLTQTSAMKAANAKAILAGRYLMTADSAKLTANAVQAAEKQKELAMASSDAKTEYQQKKQTLLAAKAAEQSAAAAVQSSQAQIQKAEMEARAMASAERNAKLHEALTARKLMLDKQEIASAAAKAVAIEQTNLRLLQGQNEKARYQHTLKYGSSAGYKSDPALLQSQKRLNDLTKEYAATQKAAASASANYDNAKKAVIATSKVEMADTTQLKAAKRDLTITENNLANAKRQTAQASTQYVTASKSVRAAFWEQVAQAKQAAAAQQLANRSMTLGGRAALIMSNGLKVAGASLKAFLASLGPLGWAMLAFSGAAMAFRYISEKNKSVLEGQVELSSRAAQASKELAAANAKARSDDNASLSRLKELSKYERLNNSEKSEAEAIVDRLTKKYGNLGIEIDSVTGRLNVGTDAWKKMNEEQTKQYGKDLNKQINSNVQEVTALQNNLRDELGSYWRNNGFNQLAVTIAGNVPFVDVDKEKLEGERYTADQREIDRLDAINDLEQQIAGYETLRNKLIENGEKKKVEAADKLIEKLKEQQQLLQRREDFLKDRKVPDGEPGSAGQAETEANKEIRKLQERLKDKNFAVKLDGIETAAEKLPQVEAEIKKIEGEKFKARGDQKKELELELKLLDLKQDYLSLVKEQKKEQKAIRDAEKDNLKMFDDRKKKLAETAIDRSIDKKLRDGDSTGAKSIMEAEYTRARDAARKMREEYRVAYNAAIADGFLSEREKEKLAELKAKLQEQWSKGDKYENMIYDQDKRDQSQKKVTVTYSAELLGLSAGPNSAQERTAKATEKSQKTLQDIKDNTTPKTATTTTNNKVKAT